MKKIISVLLTLALALCLAAGCAGTPVVYYSDCTCPVGSHTVQDTADPSVVVEGAVKTGLYIGTSLDDTADASTDANGENVNGQAKYDVTVVAVTVTEDGIIDSCVIDSIPATVAFDNTGAIVSELGEARTKNEQGEGYGMVAYGGAKYEWNQQAAFFADYVTGKTAAEVAGIAIDDAAKPTDADLASTVTISVGGFQALIAKAME